MGYIGPLPSKYMTDDWVLEFEGIGVPKGADQTQVRGWCAAVAPGAAGAVVLAGAAASGTAKCGAARDDTA